MTEATSTGVERRRARIVTYGVLCLICLCAFTGLELWPFSGFRLFSVIRTQEQVSWQLESVDASGTAQPVNLADLPVSYAGAHQVIPELVTMSLDDQQATVRAWLDGAGVDPTTVTSVRVYRIDSLVPTVQDSSADIVAKTEVLEVRLP